MNRHAFAFLLICLATSLTNGAEPETWPQWRGPNRDCQISPRKWPESLGEQNLKQAWRVELGDSYSGPIVTPDRVFVTETVGTNETVRAVDRVTGAEIWKTTWPGSMKVPFFAASNGSWIRSTPAFADGRLYVASMEDVLVCLDGATGSEVWKVDFRTKFGTGNQSFGFACSPLVENGSVFVQTAAGLVKLNCQTGDVAWQAFNESGGMMGGAFSSPIIATVAGKRQLIVQTRAKLAGVDIESGKTLWSIDVAAFRGMNILTPTVIENRIFTSSYGGGSHVYGVSPASGSGDPFKVVELAKGKSEGYMSSPVTVDGNIYLHLRNQRVTCIDSTTADTRWTSQPFGKYWSMVANGSSALALDERGDLLLLNLNPTAFSQLDSRKVSESPTWAHLAVADNQVFVRDLKGLTVYQWE